MINERFFASFDGTELYMKCNVLESPNGVIVIVHGLCEHQGRYDYVTDKLNSAGYSVYRFDHRGHGRSKGKRVYYTDFNEIVDDVNEAVKIAAAENPNIQELYSNALLRLATGKRLIGLLPLAFGKGNAKGRIMNVLNFKKPSRWVVTVVAMLVVVLSVGCAVYRTAGTSSQNAAAEKVSLNNSAGNLGLVELNNSTPAAVASAPATGSITAANDGIANITNDPSMTDLQSVTGLSDELSRHVDQVLKSNNIEYTLVKISKNPIIAGMDTHWQAYDLVGADGAAYVIILRKSQDGTYCDDFTTLLKPDGHLIEGIIDNGVTPALFEDGKYKFTESPPPISEEQKNFNTCLNDYLDCGVSFDKKNNVWLFGGKPIGYLFGDGILLIDLPFDIRERNIADEVAASDRVFLSVNNDKAGALRSTGR